MLSVLWFKRDLRLNDAPPLLAALRQGQPLVLLYLLEPEYLAHPTSSARHLRFLLQSLLDLQREISERSKGKFRLLCVEASALPFFEYLADTKQLGQVYSHEEVGLAWSFARDRKLQALFGRRGINWQEWQHGAVLRGLQQRGDWQLRREAYLSESLPVPTSSDWARAQAAELGELPFAILDVEQELRKLPQEPPVMQEGGRGQAQELLHSFIWQRSHNYMKHISKPLAAQDSCSRLSPYLAWGILSIREVYQYVEAALPLLPLAWQRKQLRLFQSRLAWHCHFIQRFETACYIEREDLHPLYSQVWEGHEREDYLQAWKTGQTGLPLVDACMRAVSATGYLNFRMRALLVSYLCHHLRQPWQSGVEHLAQQFLDFEPGIHYCQFQMQAGTMGMNRFRVYNPIKQAQEQDEQALFIKQWVPELRELPVHLACNPSDIRPLEEKFLNFSLGRDYPKPLLSLERAQDTRKALYALSATAASRTETAKLLQKHVAPRSKKS